MNKNIKDFWNRKFIKSKEVGKFGLSTLAQKISIEHEYNMFKENVLDNVKEASVLEIGCGIGIISDFLVNETSIEKLLCTDISKEGISECISKGIPASIANAENLKFHNKSFDIICGFALLHHLDNPQKAVKEACRVSRRFVYFHEPNRWNPIRHLTERFVYSKEEHETSYYPKQYKEWFKDTGFSVRIISYDFMIPYISNKFITMMNFYLGRLLEVTPIKRIGASLAIIAERK